MDVTPASYNGYFEGRWATPRHVQDSLDRRSFDVSEQLSFSEIPVSNGKPGHVIMRYDTDSREQSISIIFESWRIRTLFTSEFDKDYGFDRVLKPVAITYGESDTSTRLAMLPQRSRFSENCHLHMRDSYGLMSLITYIWKSNSACKRRKDGAWIEGWIRLPSVPKCLNLAFSNG